MDYIFQLIERLGTIYVAQSVWITLLAMILTYAIPKIFPIKKFIVAYKLRKILGFKKRHIQISIPFFSFSRIDSSGVRQNTHATSVAEVYGIMSMIHLCELVKSRATIKIAKFTEDGCQVDSNCDRFVCGGPYVNPDTYCLLQEYFHTIKFETTRRNLNNFPSQHDGFKDFSFVNDQNTDKLLRTIVVCKNWDVVRTFFVKDGGNCPTNTENTDAGEYDMITYNPSTESVIFVIRLTADNTFKNKSHGTVHILFGVKSESTRSSTKFYIDHSAQLYRMIQKAKHTQDFAYAFIVKNNNEVLFHKHVDLTRYIKK